MDKAARNNTMKYYIELTLLPNPEVSVYFLWSKLLTQLHLAFVEMQNDDAKVAVGIGFVDYKTEERKGKSYSTLGSRIRLFAPDETTLQQINLDQWLVRLTDYVHIKSIKPVPKPTQFMTVSRYRPKPPSMKDNLAYAQRRGMTEEAALIHYEQSNQTKNLPFIKLKSLTNNHEFSLTIEQQVINEEQVGLFSTYGLSGTSTVPNW